jgi:hypothetical protein
MESTMPEEKRARTGGVESKLDGVATFYLVLSVIALFACIFISQDDAVKKMGLSTFWIGLGIGALAQGVVFWILFQAGAEVIRLLKKIGGLPYAGRISETKGEGESFVCTDCGAPVSILDKYCTQCGSKLD